MPTHQGADLLDRLAGKRQKLFLHVASLTAAGDVDALRSLHASPSHPWHAVLDDLLGYRVDAHATRRLGQPYRAEQQPSVHATRALAGLGLALVDDAAASEAIEASLRWLKEAHTSADTRFEPMVVADPALKRGLGLLEASTGPDHVRAAAQAVLARLAGAVPHPSASESVKVLFAFPTGEGQEARLHMALRPGPACLVPAPDRMSLFAADAKFRQALNLAWAKAAAGRVDGTVLYWLETPTGTVPYVQDSSLGAAFTVVLDELHRRMQWTSWFRVRRLRSTTFVVGALGPTDRLVSVGGYAKKLKAAGSGRVVFPAADHDAAVEEAHDADLVPAKTWQRAASLSRRVDRKVLVRQMALGAAVMMAVAGGLVWHSNQAEQEAAQLALVRQLATQSLQMASSDPGLAGLLATEAHRIRPTPETETALFSAITAVPQLVRDGTAAERRKHQETIVSPDRSLMAVRGPGDAVEVVETRSKKKVFTVTKAEDSRIPSSTVLAWSPDGDRLAALDDATGRLRVFDREGKVLGTARPYHLREPYLRARHEASLQFGGNGRVLFVGGDSSVQPFTTDTLEPLSGRWPRPGNGEGFKGLSFGVSDPREMLVACQGGRAVAYDIHAVLKGQRTALRDIHTRTLPGVSGGCTEVSLDPGGRFLAVTSATRVALRDLLLENQRIGPERVFDKTYLTSVRWDTASEHVLLLGQDRIEAVDLLGLKPPRVFRQDEIPGVSGTNRVLDVWFDAEDPELLGVLLEDGRLRWMSWKTRNPLDIGSRLPFRSGRRPFAVNGNKAAGFTLDDGWVVTEPGTEQPTVPLRPPPVDPTDMRFSEDGSVLAVWESAGGATLWNPETGETLGVADPGSSAQEFAISGDGRFVATSVGPGSSGGGGYITLWSVADGRVTKVRTSEGLSQSGMEFMGNELIFNNGKRLIAWQTDKASPRDDRSHMLKSAPTDLATDGDVLYVATVGSVHALDRTTWKPARDTLPVNVGQMQVEGGWLITRAYANHSQRQVWNMRTGQRMGVLPAVDETDTSSSYVFSSDHKTAYGATDFGVRALTWDSSKWTRLACERAARALTPAEWQRFLGSSPYDPVCRR